MLRRSTLLPFHRDLHARDSMKGNKVTESQSHRVTDTQGYSVYGWVKFLCLISINSPTGFARRGISELTIYQGVHTAFLPYPKLSWYS